MIDQSEVIVVDKDQGARKKKKKKKIRFTIRLPFKNVELLCQSMELQY